MVQQQTLSPKQRQFCRYYSALRHPREAAARAGYPVKNAQATGQALLELGPVREYLERLARREALEAEVEAGYRRLAFGPATDAVRLALLREEDALPNIEELDLFCVTEIKRVKGGWELELANRVQALDRLWEIARQREQNADSGFYEALANASSGEGTA